MVVALTGALYAKIHRNHKLKKIGNLCAVQKLRLKAGWRGS
jgi:hypothetical protein